MKKLYNQPEVLVARIALESMVLAGSSAPEPVDNNNMEFFPLPGEQW